MNMDNLFEQAATLARVQAEGYRQVREQARNEALEEVAKILEGVRRVLIERKANCRLVALEIIERALKVVP